MQPVPDDPDDAPDELSMLDVPDELVELELTLELPELLSLMDELLGELLLSDDDDALPDDPLESLLPDESLDPLLPEDAALDSPLLLTDDE